MYDLTKIRKISLKFYLKEIKMYAIFLLKYICLYLNRIVCIFGQETTDCITNTVIQMPIHTIQIEDFSSPTWGG